MPTLGLANAHKGVFEGRVPGMNHSPAPDLLTS